MPAALAPEVDYLNFRQSRKFFRIMFGETTFIKSELFNSITLNNRYIFETIRLTELKLSELKKISIS